MLVLDRIVSDAPPKVKRLRLLRFDVKTQSSSLVASWSSEGPFDRFGLVALDDGSFILARSRPKHSTRGRETARWLVEQFTIAASGEQLVRATEEGKGEIIDDPISTTVGVFLPLAQDGQEFLQKLEPRMVHSQTHGISEM